MIIVDTHIDCPPSIWLKPRHVGTDGEGRDRDSDSVWLFGPWNEFVALVILSGAGHRVLIDMRLSWKWGKDLDVR